MVWCDEKAGVRATETKLSVTSMYYREEAQRQEIKVETAGINLSSLNNDGSMRQIQLCFVIDGIFL